MSAFMTIDAATLHGMMKQDDLILIDVRNDDEVARGIIQGAKHIPLANIPQDFQAFFFLSNYHLRRSIYKASIF